MAANYSINSGNGGTFPPPPPPFSSSASANEATSLASIASFSCPSCGIDQQRLALLQEHVSLEEQLLKEDKRNFKRRLKAAKATARKTQVHAENQLLLAEKQMKECEQKIKAAVDEVDSYKRKLEQAKGEMQDLVRAHQLDQQRYEQQLDELRQRSSQQNEITQQHTNEMTANTLMVQGILESVALDGDGDLVRDLRQQLEDKQSEIDGYEMQLLEMERELDMLRSQGIHDSGFGDVEACSGCQLLRSKMDRIEQDGRRREEQLNKKRQMEQMQLQRQVDASQKKSEEAEAARQQLETALQEHNEAKRQLEAENAALLEKLVAQQRLDEPDDARQDLDPSRVADTITTVSGNETVLTLATEADTIISTAMSPLPHEPNDDNDEEAYDDEASVALSDAESQGLRTIREQSDCSPVQPVRSLSLHPSNQHIFLVFEKEYHGPQLVGMYTGYMTLDAATKSNVPHGHGTLRLDDGAIMDGSWENGLLHGNGVLATIDGDVYHGGWQRGQKHGLGTLVYSDGRVYRGDFEGDNRHGQGYITWPYGAHYHGEFRNDKRNGAGEYRYADGRTYSGKYSDDRPHGYGVLRSRDGSVIYDGQWELGEYLGDGK